MKNSLRVRECNSGTHFLNYPHRFEFVEFAGQENVIQGLNSTWHNVPSDVVVEIVRDNRHDGRMLELTLTSNFASKALAIDLDLCGIGLN
jgi:hypothetical protein